jgi:3-hydroxyacyl-[acyl-carrier-protein] dehydratase
MRELYTTSATAEATLFEVRLNPAHPLFGGHFPGNPVLPGVCSMMAVRECAGLVAGRALRYASVGECKFLKAITPDDTLSVSVKLAEGYALTATIQCAETLALKLKARLVPDE